MRSLTVRPVRCLLAAVVILALAGCSADASDSGVSGSPRASMAATPDDVRLVAPEPLHVSVDDWPAGTVAVDPGEGAADLFVGVRIAATSDRRQHGLMEVPVVPDGTGMWFAYDEDRTGSFWMKGTRTDLDIAWVDGSGRIVAVDTMQVCTSDPCPKYDPGATYRTALEVPAGWLAANDVQVGDTAVLVTTTP